MLAKEGKFDLKLDHVICVSAAVRDILVNAGLPLDQAQVIHGGTDVERFADTSMRNGGSSRLRLLYAGQLVRHKGVHTAIEAVAKLVNEHDVKQLHLTVVGSGHPTYEAFLHALVDREELHDCVSFYGPAAKSEMPAILQQADVLVFPSVYDEPFARMTQEAMLAGLTVVGTTTGGTKEILVEGENGLTFAAEDADALARQIRRLVTSPNLCRQLAEAGRRTVLENYTLDKMVDQIEDYLQEVVSTAQTKTAVSREIARDY
jgi:glycosyltransferase involved in cell wall biosynthesis